VNKNEIEKLKERKEDVIYYMGKALAQEMFYIMKRDGYRQPDKTIIDEEIMVSELIYMALDMLETENSVYISTGGYTIILKKEKKKLSISVVRDLLEDEWEV